MDFKLFTTLIDYKRIPRYTRALSYGIMHNELLFRFKFPGMLSLPEGTTLSRITRSLPEKSVIVEIGCYGGLSTAFILNSTKKGMTVYSLDPFRTNMDDQKQQYINNTDKVYERDLSVPLIMKKPSKQTVAKSLKESGFKNFHLMEGYSFDFAKTWKKKINFLWIDADHEYKAVKKDFLDWSPFLVKGGIIAFHDSNKNDNSPYWTWGWKGPTRVVKENIKEPKWTNIHHVDSITYATKNY